MKLPLLKRHIQKKKKKKLRQREVTDKRQKGEKFRQIGGSHFNQTDAGRIQTIGIPTPPIPFL